MINAFPGSEIIDPATDVGKVFYKNLQKIIDINPPFSDSIDTTVMKNSILGAIESAIFIFRFTDLFNPQHGIAYTYLKAIYEQNIYISYGTGQVQVGASIAPYSTFVNNLILPYRQRMVSNGNLAVYLGVTDPSVVVTSEESSVYPPSSKFIQDVKTGNIYV